MGSKSGKLAIGLETLAAVVVCLLAVSPAYPQVTGGTVSGTVTDISGAVIPNAKISVKNLATGITRDVTADAAGFYTAPNLLPGAYELTTSAPGFSTEVRTGITLTVGAQQVLNFTLQVGQVTQKVQVTGEAPSVQLATSSISAQVNSTTVLELPLNGRSWTDLAALQPGVAAVQTQSSSGGSRSNRGFGSEVAVSGARPQQINYRLDGITINDYMNGSPGDVLGGDLGVDAIQEFSVLTSNYSAEYGRTSGGVVNAITRSGSNQFHGSAYEFLRNSALDARNFFDLQKIPPFRRNQFGASAGGPIRKDKLFIFGDYEGIRQSKGVAQVSTVPSLAARSGSLCSIPGSPPACTPTTVTVDPAAQKYLPIWPLPNGPIIGNGDTGVFGLEGQQAFTENFFTTRVDEKFSQKDSLFGTYLYDNNPFTYPDPFNIVLEDFHANRQTAVLEETHIFSPALVNSARIGYNRVSADSNATAKAISPLATDKSLGSDPGQTAAQVHVGGISWFNSGALHSLNGNLWAWNSYQVYDDAFLTHGTHAIKFGAAVEHMQTAETARTEPGGLWSFGTLKAFLTNQPRSFETGLAQTQTPRYMHQTLFGGYVQDDWRCRPNLTLNLGLRYEMVTVPTEAHNRIALLHSFADPNYHLGSPAYSNSTLRDFSPRVGFAWDPFHRGKTAVRGGFGVFDSLPLPYETTVLFANGAPFSSLLRIAPAPAGSFYTGAFPLLQPTANQTDYIEQNPPRSYVMQWNLNVQHQLTPSVAVLLGYVGVRGVHQQFRTDDGNFVIPTPTPAGYLWPNPVGSGTLVNPNFGEIRAVMWPISTAYDALQLGVQKRMSHGIQVQGSYTWGKSIDEGSSSGFGDSFTNSIASEQWFNLKAFRGLADFNIARTLVIDTVWDVPVPNSIPGPAAWLVRGWELGAIYKASDGAPFTATFGTDGDPLGLNNTDPWAFPNRLTGPGCQSLVNPGNPNNYIKTQCFAVPTAPSAAFYAANCDPTFGTFPQCFNLRGNAGRNILIGPGTSNLDFSVYKNNPIKRISETFSVQFRAEFFNILNRPNFAVPFSPTNTDIFDSTGAPTGIAGLLTSTTTTAREIQFALKLIW
jgi:Carboxypeptidase regulatory-like domain/TonB-dependent Receptor Plug Domain/TonB dependent receptor-like, beta-barrel